MEVLEENQLNPFLEFSRLLPALLLHDCILERHCWCLRSLLAQQGEWLKTQLTKALCIQRNHTMSLAQGINHVD